MWAWSEQVGRDFEVVLSDTGEADNDSAGERPTGDIPMTASMRYAETPTAARTAPPADNRRSGEREHRRGRRSGGDGDVDYFVRRYFVPRE